MLMHRETDLATTIEHSQILSDECWDTDRSDKLT